VDQDDDPTDRKEPTMTADRAWVLLHGTPLDPDVWTELAPRLRSRQPVVAPAVASLAGASDPQAALAARLAGELDDVAERWDVVGHSFGGQIALDLALLAPERIASLSIICSRDTPFPAFAAAAADLRAGAAPNPEAALTRWFRPDELRAGGWLVGYAHDRITHADHERWATDLDGIARYDRSARVGAISAPATLICAAHDPVSDVAAMTALAGRLPNAQLHVDAEAAHCSPLLDAQLLAARLSGPLG
jgi:pimeloyl-ACP methyl ester carboxylesterase